MAYPANLRGWGPGWPTDRSREMRWVRAERSGARWQVHYDIAPIVQFIVDTIESRGYLFDYGPNDTDDDWGYNNRPISGTRTPSNHSWGLAIDIDAQEYPQGTRKRPPQWIIDLFEKYGFEWGGDWSYRDPMHFEFRGSRTEARHMVAMLAASYLAKKPPPLPAATPAPKLPSREAMAFVALKFVKQMPDLHPGNKSKNLHVIWLQRALNIARGVGLADDGMYGDRTVLAVAAFQHDLAKFGVANPDRIGHAERFTRWYLAAALHNIATGKTP